jgi:hypothetical protein
VFIRLDRKKQHHHQRERWSPLTGNSTLPRRAGRQQMATLFSHLGLAEAFGGWVGGRLALLKRGD